MPTPLVAGRLALLLLAASACPLLADEAGWAMRSRVFCDNQSGISFRYPYGYKVPDQYKAELVRVDPELQSAGVISEVLIDGKKVKVLITNEPQSSEPDVRAFSSLASQLPAGSPTELAAIGNRLTGRTLSWKAFDYYQKSNGRPQAAASWAPKELVAMIGDSGKSCGLIVKHGERYSGLVLSGGLSSGDNQAIIDSFEVMAGGKGKLPFQTWREGQGHAGKVLASDGKPVTASGHGPATWKDGWDLETAHYHISTQVSPARLVQYGVYLEALYRAYSGIYEPDSVPPYKMEIHIFNTQEDFMTAAAAHNFPVGQTVGGFFAFIDQSIYAYEESSKWGGDSFSVEHVLAHECSHQFLHMACNGSEHVPTWINEGLAVYFESGIFKNGSFVIQPPRERIARLKEIYDRLHHSIIPLDGYLSNYSHISPDMYGEVYAMTCFWLFGTCDENCKHKDCGLARFRLYWQALKRHENGTKAFESIFMADMEKAKGSHQAAVSAWESAYLYYVKNALK
jgi:hypothetical protein